MLSHLPHTGSILRPGYQTDDYGNDTETWAGPGTPIDCWVQQNTRADEVGDGRRARTSSFLLITDADAALFTGTERFTWNEAPGGPMTLEVDGPGEAACTLMGFHHTEVTLRRVDG